MAKRATRITAQRASFLLLLAVITPANADQTDQFLDQHWQRPIPAQGKVPKHYSALEASLAPEDCGTCHTKQYQDWSQSLHSKAMGPGLMGQLVDMPAHARGDHQSCLRCHAPLAEQADALVREIETGQQQGLHRQGLICAACHVRQHQRYGPKRRDGTTPADNLPLPHNGWQVSDAFEDSRFCATCHQFEADEFSLNGKLLENTYNEWLDSDYSRRGVSCQNCHMPDRKHQWKGIHDPQMVRQGVDISARIHSLEKQTIDASVTIKNSNTGHRFPTYVTPQVVLEGYQQDQQGDRIDGTESYFVVARRVALNLSQEIFDTRLAPGQTATLSYQQIRHPQAAVFVAKVWVQPDFFYQQFYQSALDSNATQRGKEELQQALREVSESRYTLFEQQLNFYEIQQH
ncbi:MAG: multiheme c-type cytochrome [Motiliproteus sp.]